MKNKDIFMKLLDITTEVEESCEGSCSYVIHVCAL